MHYDHGNPVGIVLSIQKGSTSKEMKANRNVGK